MEKVKAKIVKFKRWLITSIAIIIVFLASFFAIPILFPPTPPTGATSTVTLRPNAAGTYQNWACAGTHYTYTSDQNDGSFVYIVTSTTAKETENLADSSRTEVIESVTAYFRAMVIDGASTTEKAVVLWRSTNDYESAAKTISRVAFTNYSEVRTVNPYTSAAWTWTQVNALQVGIRASALDTDEEIDCSEFWIVVTYTVPPPTYSNVATNTTLAAQPCKFSVLWNDAANVSGFIFGTDNTGSFVNDTWVAFTTFFNTTAAWSNITKTLTDGVIQWQVWANNTNNVWNNTGIQTFTAVRNFGYTTIGGSQTTINDTVRGSLFNVTNNGEANSITVALKCATTWTGNVTCAIYRHNTLSLIGTTERQSLTLTTSKVWYVFNFTAPKPNVQTTLQYILATWAQNVTGSISVALDGESVLNQGHYQSITYDGFPNPLVPTHVGHQYSIFCNYTSDSTLPTYSNVATNTTVGGKPCKFSTLWNDKVNVTGYIFGTNNTGAWTNESWTAFTTFYNATAAWSNITKVLNNAPVEDIRIEWEIWTNDTCNNWNSTGLQYLIVGYSSLISNLINLADSINWTENIETIYLGTMFGKTNMTDLQNAIAASTSWQDVLMWSAITMKFGIENETKIEWALNNATMVVGLPNCSGASYDSFEVCYRGLLYGYYWANKYSYLQDKWNLTAATNNFASAYNWTGHGFLYYINASYTASYGSRYLDEHAQTLACFLVFYDVCSASSMLTYAETEWIWLNNNLWCTDPTYGAPHFAYTEGSGWYANGWECSGGAFLQIIGWLKYLSANVGNISRLMTDMSNRFIVDRWYSPQWDYNDSGTITPYPAIVIHHNTHNLQRRLSSTVTAWSSLFSMYLLFNDTEIQKFQDELNGYGTYPLAWKCLYNTTAYLYDVSTTTFRSSSSSAPSNTATALATSLQFFLGITPINGTLAVPIESLEYEHLYNMFDSQIFNVSLTTRKVTVGISATGTLNFTFNATATQAFSSVGLYELTFDSDWNTITNCTKIGSLPDRRYLEIGTKLFIGWNNFAAWNVDVGKTLGQVNASLNLNSINWSVVTIDYGNGTQWSLVYGTSFNGDKLIASITDTLWIYCNVADEWRHTYP